MTVTIESRPGHRRRLVLCSLLVAAAVLAGLGLLYHRKTAQIVPPSFEKEGIDPGVAAVLEEKSEAARRLRTGRAWGELGMTFLAHGFDSQAVPCLRQAEKLEPEEPRWPYLQGIALRPEHGVKPLKRVVQMCDNSPDTPRLLLGERLLELNRPDEAAEQFTRLLDAAPKNARAHLGMARVEHQRGNLDESLRHLAYAEKDSHTRKAAYLLLAQVHQQRKENDAATQASRKAERLGKDVPWPDPFYEEMLGFEVGLKGTLRRARKMFQEGRAGEAVDLLQETTRKYPDSVMALTLLGKAYELQGNLADAEATLGKALEQAPDSTDALFRLGVVLVRQDRYADAAARFRQAVELQPSFAAAYFNLGHCLLKTGDRPAAIAAYRGAVEADPGFAEAHLALANQLEKSGRHVEAIAECRTVLTLNPDNREARKLLDSALKQKRD